MEGKKESLKIDMKWLPKNLSEDDIDIINKKLNYLNDHVIEPLIISSNWQIECLLGNYPEDNSIWNQRDNWDASAEFYLIASGNLNIVKKLVNERPLKSLINTNKFKKNIVHMAIHLGFFDMTKYLYTIDGLKPLFMQESDNNSNIVHDATSANSLEILNWINSIKEFNTLFFLKNDLGNVIHVAILSKHLGLLDWFYEIEDFRIIFFQRSNPKVTKDELDLAHFSVRVDNFDALKWISKKSDLQSFFENDDLCPIHLQVLPKSQSDFFWLLKSYPGLKHKKDRDGRNAAHTAVLKNRLDVLKELYKNPEYKFLFFEQGREGYNIAFYAVARGFWDIFDWIYQQEDLRSLIYKKVKNKNIVHVGVEHNQLDLLKKLEEKEDIKNFFFEKDNLGWNIVHLSIDSKKIETFQWLSQNNSFQSLFLEKIQIRTNNKGILKEIDLVAFATFFGNVEILELLHKEAEFRPLFLKNDNNIFDLALKRGNFNAIQWIYTIEDLKSLFWEQNGYFIERIISHNNVDMLKWIYGKKDLKRMLFLKENNFNIAYIAVRCKAFEVLKWIHETKELQPLITEKKARKTAMVFNINILNIRKRNSYNIGYAAMVSGDVKIFQWLSQHYSYLCEGLFISILFMSPNPVEMVSLIKFTEKDTENLNYLNFKKIPDEYKEKAVASLKMVMLHKKIPEKYIPLELLKFVSMDISLSPDNNDIERKNLALLEMFTFLQIVYKYPEFQILHPIILEIFEYLLPSNTKNIQKNFLSLKERAHPNNAFRLKNHTVISLIAKVEDGYKLSLSNFFKQESSQKIALKELKICFSDDKTVTENDLKDWYSRDKQAFSQNALSKYFDSNEETIMGLILKICNIFKFDKNAVIENDSRSLSH